MINIVGLCYIGLHSTYCNKQWRQREFKVGGTKRRRLCGCGERLGEGGGKFFCYVISKWHILVNSEVLNLKFFFIVSSLSRVLGGLCGKFWIFEQSNVV